jgi:ketol-acid reductoisomerase
MKTNQEILDTFGKLIVSNVYDDGLSYFKQIISNSTKWGTGKEYSDVFAKLSVRDQCIMAQYIENILSTSIFAFLNTIEENAEFKIIYEEDNNEQINLAEISESLKAEPLSEYGWIQRFSQEIKSGKDNGINTL